MAIFKTRWFKKWAQKNCLSDYELLDAFTCLEELKSTVNLGGNLFKIRIASKSEGKSGGFRTIIAYKHRHRAVFLFGFSKNDLDNLKPDEIYALKKLAKDFMSYDDEEIKRQLDMKNIFALEENNEQ